MLIRSLSVENGFARNGFARGRRARTCLVAMSTVLGLAGACSSGGGGSGAAGQAGAAGVGVATGGNAGGASGAAGLGGATGAAGMGAAGESVAGASGSAGGGSAAGAGGGAGTTGGAGGGGGSSASNPTGMSAGCGKAVNEPAGMWTRHDIMVTVDAKFSALAKRTYFTNPPAGYDASIPSTLTIWGNGCGQGANAEGELLQSGPAAQGSVQVQLLASSSNHACFSAGPDGDNVDSPELPYFDALLSEVEDEYCIDKSKVFVSGYSSGAWFTALMACNRADVIRGVGWAAAGLQLNHAPCAGSLAAIVVRGVNDTGTPAAQTLAAVSDLVARDGCSTTTTPWDPGEKAFDTSSCVAYQGCQAGFPVVYCAVPGGHTDGGSLTGQGFWKLWTSL
jgi:polyhydroxybutyrate depolymerase